MTAAVLAGGQSRRMGEDKALLKFDGRYLIEVLVDRIKSAFDRIFVVTNAPDKLDFLKLDKFRDAIDAPHSSLRGIYSALERSDAEHTFVLACDMPFVNERLIKFMMSKRKGYDVVIPQLAGRRLEPLHAIYAKRCTARLKMQLEKGELEIKAAFSGLNIRRIPEDDIRRFDPESLSLFNINTKDDYDRALKLAGGL